MEKRGFWHPRVWPVETFKYNREATSEVDGEGLHRMGVGDWGELAKKKSPPP